jgi:hypothetical protein
MSRVGTKEPNVAVKSVQRGIDINSAAYIVMPMPIWRTLLKHCTLFARSLALLNAGNKRAARTALMAITTSNSMSVNATLQARPRCLNPGAGVSVNLFCNEALRFKDFHQTRAHYCRRRSQNT